MGDSYRLQISSLSRAQFLDLKRRMPQGAVEAHEGPRTSEELGVLEPITATVIITLGLASLDTLGYWLTKNQQTESIRMVRTMSTGEREEITIKLNSSSTAADVIEAVSRNMPKAPDLFDK